MVGVAVKVMDAPAQVGLLPEVTAILTAGTSVELTVIVMVLLVAVAGLAQLAFDVRMQLTTWPFVRPVEVYVVLFVPTLLPLTCHW